MIKIILVEDHQLVRNGIKLLLEGQNYINIITETGTGQEALAYLRGEEALAIDMVVTDLNMPDMDGWSLTKKIRKEFPDIKVLILSAVDDSESIKSAFNNGAHGYLLKNVEYNELLSCIKFIHKGGKYLCQELAFRFLDSSTEGRDLEKERVFIMEELDISERELEVLKLIGEGLTNIEIADRIFLSKRTVEGHRQSLIRKTNTQNTASLVKFAVANGLLD